MIVFFGIYINTPLGQPGGKGMVVTTDAQRSSREDLVMHRSSLFLFDGFLLAAGWRERRDGERGE